MRLLGLFIVCISSLALVGCGTAPATVDAGPREPISVEECEAQGGAVIGDPGDGSTHEPDYVCPNGAPPTASVEFGIEGGVCCEE